MLEGAADEATSGLRSVAEPAGLVRELDLLRRRAAVGTGRRQVSLERIAASTGIPRSTVHSYLRGVRLPPPDSLDAIVVALGATGPEQRQWAEALTRVCEPPARTDGAPAPWVAGAPAVPRHLPAAPRGFVGRQAELAALHEVSGVADDAGPGVIVRVCGTAGVGKSALVLTWAHRVVDAFPDGQLWIDLRGFGPRPPHRPADILERMLRAIDVPPAQLPPDVEARGDLLRSRLADRRMLIVLDNARDADQVRPLLPGAGRCVTVVTSRSALRSLAVVEGAERVDLQRLAPDAALSLLTGPAGTLARHDDGVLRELVERCDGLPLALRIVRERLASATSCQVAAFTRSIAAGHPARLAAFDLNDPGHEISVRAALDWSFRALPPTAATLLARLPLCRTSLPDTEAAAAVLGADEPTTRHAVDALVSASLIEPAGGDRYRVHDLVAGFAELRLAEHRESDTLAARRRIVQHYLMRTDDVGLLLRPAPAPNLPLPDDVPTTPRAAFGSPQEAQDWTVAVVDAVAAVIRDAVALGLPRHACALAERVSRALVHSVGIGPLDESVRCARDAALQAGDHLAAAVASRHLGISRAHSGMLPEAEVELTRAVALSGSAGDPDTESKDRTNVAVVQIMQGRLEQARAQLEQALELRRALPGPVLTIYVNMALIEHHTGDADAFDRRLAQAWAQSDVTSDSLWHGNLLLLSATSAHERGEPARRDALLDRAEAVTARGVHRDVMSKVLILRAAVADHAGDHALATELAAEAVRLSGQQGAREQNIQAQRMLAAAVAHTDPARALELMTQVRERAARAGLRYEQALATVQTARLMLGAGRGAQAADVAREGRRIAAEARFQAVVRDADAVIDRASAGAPVADARPDRDTMLV